MLYEIHMIKNYPPTNLNRDDTGAPKTCMFGGALRGRISSQCLKRSWRTSEIFRQAIGNPISVSAPANCRNWLWMNCGHAVCRKHIWQSYCPN